MTTLRSIVIDAFRVSNLTAAGEVPDTDEFDEGLRKLVQFIESVYSYEIGEQFLSVSYGTSGSSTYAAKYEDLKSYIGATYVPANVRLMVYQDSPSTIHLDPIPDDGAMLNIIDVGNNLSSNALTINGNGRRIEGADSIVINTDSINKKWFYREDLGQWVARSALTANSQMPLPTEFDEFFILSLAMRLNPSYGLETRPETQMQLRRAASHLRARYRQRNEIIPELALSRMDRAIFGFYDKSFELGRIR